MVTIDIDKIAACIGRLVTGGEGLPSAVRRRLGPLYRPHYEAALIRAIELGYVDALYGERLAPGPVTPPDRAPLQLARKATSTGRTSQPARKERVMRQWKIVHRSGSGVRELMLTASFRIEGGAAVFRNADGEIVMAIGPGCWLLVTPEES